MKHFRALILSLACFVTLAFLNSCEEREGSCDESNISTTASSKSHNAGRNCMSCHTERGSGEGCFNVAGTLYESASDRTVSGATVYLYTGENGTGTLAATVQVDQKGNFHTTENVNFGGGLYPVVVKGGTTVSMPSAITDGACNRCHGGTTDKLRL